MYYTYQHGYFKEWTCSKSPLPALIIERETCKENVSASKGRGEWNQTGPTSNYIIYKWATESSLKFLDYKKIWSWWIFKILKDT